MSTTSVATANQLAVNAHRDRRSLVTLLRGMLNRTIAQIDPEPVPFPRFFKQAAETTALPTAGNGTDLGLAAALGSPLLGSTSNNTSVTEKAATQIFMSPRYVAGEPVTVRVRAKVAIARQVSATVVPLFKRVVDGAIGADLNATAAQALTIAYADYDFVITPTTLLPGDVIDLELSVVNNDTGGAGGAAAVSISKVTVLQTAAAT